MKFWTILLCLLCAAPVLASDSEKKDVRDVEIVLLHLERLKFEAQQRNDCAAVASMLDDTILWVGPNGVLITKAAYLESFHDPNHQVLRVIPESMTVKVFGRIVIVVGIYDEKGLQAGRAYHQRCRFIDTWAFKKGTWVCIAATATSVIS